MAAAARRIDQHAPLDMRRMAKAMPAGLMVYDNPQLVVARHHAFLNQKLLAFARDVRDKKDPRLLLSFPPRTGKTTLAGQYFPAWFLGVFPESRIIYTSYSADLARTSGRKVRDILAEHGKPLWGTEIRDDVRDASAWQTTKGGGMKTAGRGGSITGFGANILIHDDPIKNAEEARSPVITESAWEWDRSTARTRVQPGGGILKIGTRWSKADPIGRQIEAQQQPDWDGDVFEVVNVPALALENDPLGRAPGEAIWPEAGWTVERYQKLRASVGSIWFSALYQGNPVPEEGALFRRSDFRYFTIEGDGEAQVLVLHDQEAGVEQARARSFRREDCQVVAFMDPAATEGQLSAFTVITVWLITPESDLLLVDVIREKVETTKHRSLMASARARWGEGLLIVVEKGAFGFHVIQEERAKGKNIRPIKAEKDKVARARIAEARFAVHKVFFPRHAPFLSVVEGELLDFPLGPYKDITDTVAYACAWTAYGTFDDYHEDDSPFDMGRFY